MNDTIINIDLLFKEGEGRTRDGIRAAHKIADTVINSIRKELKKIEARPVRTEKYNAEKKTAKKIVLVKSVSGLGNMYETAMFPDQPGGYLGAYSTMDFMNMPVVVTANQVLDGVIHSLI